MHESWDGPLPPAPEGSSNRLFRWLQSRKKRIRRNVELTDAVTKDITQKHLYEGFRIDRCSNDRKIFCMTMAISRERLFAVLVDAVDQMGNNIHIDALRHPINGTKEIRNRFGIESVVLKSELENHRDAILNDGEFEMWIYNADTWPHVHMNRSRLIDIYSDRYRFLDVFARKHELQKAYRFPTIETISHTFHPNYGENGESAIVEFLNAIRAETKNMFESNWPYESDYDNEE